MTLVLETLKSREPADSSHWPSEVSALLFRADSAMVSAQPLLTTLAVAALVQLLSPGPGPRREREWAFTISSSTLCWDFEWQDTKIANIRSLPRFLFWVWRRPYMSHDRRARSTYYAQKIAGIPQIKFIICMQIYTTRGNYTYSQCFDVGL